MMTLEQIKGAELLVIEEAADSQLDAGSDLVSSTFEWYWKRMAEERKRAATPAGKKQFGSQKRLGAWRRARAIFFCLAHASVKEINETVAAQIAKEFPGEIGVEIAKEIIGQEA